MAVGLISVACIGVLQPCGLRSIADANKITTDLGSTLILGPENESLSICALMSRYKRSIRQILHSIYPSWMSTSIFRQSPSLVSSCIACNRSLG